MSGSFANRALNYVDFYGESVELNIRGKAKSETEIGGILSMITVALLIAAAWSTGKDLFYKEQPSINIEDQLLSKRPFLNLDKNSFPIAIALQDYNGNVYNNASLFTVQVFLTSIENINHTSSSQSYEIEPCQYTHFPNILPSNIDSAGLLYYSCIKNQNISIGGYWDDVSLNYLTVQISQCVNATDLSGIVCASVNVIEDFINQQTLAWNLYVQNSLINTQNYDDPVKYYILNLWKNIHLGMSKTDSFYIKTQAIETDKGILFESLETVSALCYDTSEYDDSAVGPYVNMDTICF